MQFVAESFKEIGSISVVFKDNEVQSLGHWEDNVRQWWSGDNDDGTQVYLVLLYESDFPIG